MTPYTALAALLGLIVGILATYDHCVWEPRRKARRAVRKSLLDETESG